nr:MAG TPA: hypothetical protein [Caudoviricetes sp.]
MVKGLTPITLRPLPQLVIVLLVIGLLLNTIVSQGNQQSPTQLHH